MTLDLSKVGAELSETTYTYKEKDAILYALGIGCGGSKEDLKYVYENGLEVFPTFGVLPSFGAILEGLSLLQANLIMLLHGEQEIRLERPIPPSATLTTKGRIPAVYDKGKGAVVVIDSETRDKDGPLFSNHFVAFIRGEGGFGGDRGPSGDRNVPPARNPDHVVEMPTLPQQAALYRLSGDSNPLHIDPSFAKMAGYERPILHGLCSYGQVARAVVSALAKNEPARLKHFEARFAGVVFPGETIVARIWDAGSGGVLFEAATKERGETVLKAGAATVR